MVSKFYSLAIGILISLQAVRATVYCNATQSCPEDKPCCTQYGECGTGQYCLGNCDPRFSFNIDACMPVPVCKNMNTKFNKYADNIVNSYTYLGNATEADWIYSGYIMDYEDEDSLVLAMPKNSPGTVLSSTRALWYGKVSATMKSSHRQGVITAMILFSGIQDEIDYEFVGDNLTQAETNYYFQGALNFTHGTNISTSDTFENFHTYEMDWREDYIKWSVDGVVGRTLHRNDTYNMTTKQYDFPQTPSKINISIWPGGNATNPPGTVAWSGGVIDWNAPDIVDDPGYYYAVLKEVDIECYDPPPSAVINGTEAYKYINPDSFMSGDVAITDAEIMLGSRAATGMDPEEGVSVSSEEPSSTMESSTMESSTMESSTIDSSTMESTTESSSIESSSSTSTTTSSESSTETTTSSSSSSTSTGKATTKTPLSGLISSLAIVIGYLL